MRPAQARVALAAAAAGSALWATQGLRGLSLYTAGGGPGVEGERPALRLSEPPPPEPREPAAAEGAPPLCRRERGARAGPVAPARPAPHRLPAGVAGQRDAARRRRARGRSTGGRCKRCEPTPSAWGFLRDAPCRRLDAADAAAALASRLDELAFLGDSVAEQLFNGAVWARAAAAGASGGAESMEVAIHEWWRRPRWRRPASTGVEVLAEADSEVGEIDKEELDGGISEQEAARLGSGAAHSITQSGLSVGVAAPAVEDGEQLDSGLGAEGRVLRGAQLAHATAVECMELRATVWSLMREVALSDKEAALEPQGEAGVGRALEKDVEVASVGRGENGSGRAPQEEAFEEERRDGGGAVPTSRAARPRWADLGSSDRGSGSDGAFDQLKVASEGGAGARGEVARLGDLVEAPSREHPLGPAEEDEERILMDFAVCVSNEDEQRFLVDFFAGLYQGQRTLLVSRLVEQGLASGPLHILRLGCGGFVEVVEALATSMFVLGVEPEN
ncbi:unnamed protein product [Prorocentrum cordatum]|uniref:RNase III domain-containing protein n=1 Tax=Prorocentrum cordatum TaxID=2364126 RepID=A0ABN9W3Z4_9DINO|nr:unnamed protein product [Polarella glacialis]